MPEKILDPFRGCFEDGHPRDPGHAWNLEKPMAPELLARVLTEVLEERGVKGYRVTVTRD